MGFTDPALPMTARTRRRRQSVHASLNLIEASPDHAAGHGVQYSRDADALSLSRGGAGPGDGDVSRRPCAARDAGRRWRRDIRRVDRALNKPGAKLERASARTAATS